jgi:hypothetical protein
LSHATATADDEDGTFRKKHFSHETPPLRSDKEISAPRVAVYPQLSADARESNR